MSDAPLKQETPPLEDQVPHSGGDEKKSGMVAIVGRANVGKSSLMNTILQDKVSIVSHVAQTTRNQIRGIHSDEQGQLVFLDTPGVFKSSSDLGRLMNRAARASIDGVDVVMLVLDPSGKPREEDEGWMRKLARSPVPVVMVLNKRDLDWPYESFYREAWGRCTAEGEPEPSVVWMEASAQTGLGVPELLSQLYDLVPCGPLLFPEDTLTDFPRRLAVADVIREQYFQVLRDEVPHDLAVCVRDLQESESGWQVHADILINRPTQKGIVIGEKGRLLRRVKRAASRDLSEMYAVPVTLHLWIKVEKNWSRNFWILRQLGYS